MANNILVAVRCRPLFANEQQSCISVDGNSITVQSKEAKTFSYDHLFDDTTTQEGIYDTLGNRVLQSALEGYHSTIFAYGQTGSGKSHSVMGTQDDPGILMRVVRALFENIDKAPEMQYKTIGSFLEIYNEKLRDLFVAKPEKDLNIASHPIYGPHVPGITEAAMENVDDVRRMLRFGNQQRVVAATSMNAQSSRSHAILTLELTSKEARSCIHFVDLAGSERSLATASSAVKNQKEGSHINKSLTALGMVISALAKKAKFAPFRNSKLTYFLMESLSGNSKTVMLANVRPDKKSAEETISTLRFAQTCKKITTHAKKNVDSKETLLEDLKAEMEALRAQLAQKTEGNVSGKLSEELNQKQFLISKLHENAKEASLKQRKVLDSIGLKGFADDGLTPYLVNISEDPLLAGLLMFFIPLNQCTTVGSAEDNSIVFTHGLGITPYMCTLRNEDNFIIHVGGIVDESAKIFVNRTRAHAGSEKVMVSIEHNGKLSFGLAHHFRLIVPLEKENTFAPEETFDLCDVLDADSEQYAIAETFLRKTTDRSGPAAAAELMEQFKILFPQIAEANEIASALANRGGYVPEGQFHLVTFEPVFGDELPSFAVGLNDSLWTEFTFIETLDALRDFYDTGVGIEQDHVVWKAAPWDYVADHVFSEIQLDQEELVRTHQAECERLLRKITNLTSHNEAHVAKISMLTTIERSPQEAATRQAARNADIMNELEKAYERVREAEAQSNQREEELRAVTEEVFNLRIREEALVRAMEQMSAQLHKSEQKGAQLMKQIGVGALNPTDTGSKGSFRLAGYSPAALHMRISSMADVQGNKPVDPAAFGSMSATDAPLLLRNISKREVHIDENHQYFCNFEGGTASCRNGEQCEACNKLVLDMETLPEELTNADGVRALRPTKSKSVLIGDIGRLPKHAFYCGRFIGLVCRCGTCPEDVRDRCGPDGGCPCDPCKLLVKTYDESRNKKYAIQKLNSSSSMGKIQTKAMEILGN
eukprot:GEMP01007099.1.p1 GENE.GEMP01007099.1~~GEMP01007099.1.p1  ORF type:complete len:994 (+),score=218.19 GEMP01007099.1:181-3162(+)